jgi:pyruvate,water dikinase
MIRRTELRDALAAEPPPDLETLAERRRSELAQGLARGPEPYLGDPPEERDREAILEKFYGRGAGQAGSDRVRGEGASPGVARGPARVVSGPEDFGRVRAGDVLIAATTTPAWTPLFASIAGLVTETGGILSHAAIVAREYGLPAVVGATDARKLLVDGGLVEVDGRTGIVTVLPAGGSGDPKRH